jgi:uncharacterized repeat protein (TIGR02543 family)
MGNLTAGSYADLVQHLQVNADSEKNITVTASFPITDALTVNPGGAAGNVRITSGEGGPFILTRGETFVAPLFTVPDAVSLTLDHIILDGGNTVLPPALRAQLREEASPDPGADETPRPAGGPLVVNFGTLTINEGAVLRNNLNFAPLPPIEPIQQRRTPRESDDIYLRAGGAIFSYGHLVMNGGMLKNNVAEFGGGVFSRGPFDMAGGLIIQNFGLDTGGGILQGSKAIPIGVETKPAPTGDETATSYFTMTGGAITGNFAGIFGGGVSLNTLFSLSGGEIKNNRAKFGGGVDVFSTSFTMTGGKISGNTAECWENDCATNFGGIGGGVHVEDASFTMTGGEISYNTANADGGGVFDHRAEGLSIAPHAVFFCNSASRAFEPGSATENIAADEWTSPFTEGLNDFDVYISGMEPPSKLAEKVIVLPAPVPSAPVSFTPVPVYAVTYSGNGGKPEETQRNVAEGGVPCPPDDPVRPGYTFTGWYTDSDCTIPYDGGPIDADTPLYAGWEQQELVVTPEGPGPWLPPCQCKGRRG